MICSCVTCLSSGVKVEEPFESSSEQLNVTPAEEECASVVSVSSHGSFDSSNSASTESVSSSVATAGSAAHEEFAWSDTEQRQEGRSARADFLRAASAPLAACAEGSNVRFLLEYTDSYAQTLRHVAQAATKEDEQKDAAIREQQERIASLERQLGEQRSVHLLQARLNEQKAESLARERELEETIHRPVRECLSQVRVWQQRALSALLRPSTSTPSP